MIFILVIAAAGMIAIILTNHKMDTDFYKCKLSDQLESYYACRKKVVWLDFKSFESLFKLSPDSWELQGSILENLKHTKGDKSKEHFILFKKEKDYKKAIALFKEYQENKKEKWTYEKEIRDFESFKETIQFEINQKKKEAEKEIEEANQFLNNLTKKE